MEGVRCWPWETFKVGESTVVGASITHKYSNTFQYLHFSRGKKKNVHPQVHEDQVDQEANAEFVENLTGVEEGLFVCPEESCIRRFLRYSSMQQHLGFGEHERALERETLTDRAVKVYGENLKGQTPSVPEVIANSRPDIIPDSCRKVPMGWALRAGAPRKRFTSSQKAYLTAKFKLGE